MYMNSVAPVNFNGYLDCKNATRICTTLESTSENILLHTNIIKGIKKMPISATSYMEDMGIRTNCSGYNALKENIEKMIDATSVILLDNGLMYKVKMPYSKLVEIYERAKTSEDTFTIS